MAKYKLENITNDKTLLKYLNFDDEYFEKVWLSILNYSIPISLIFFFLTLVAFISTQYDLEISWNDISQIISSILTIVLIAFVSFIGAFFLLFAIHFAGMILLLVIESIFFSIIKITPKFKHQKNYSHRRKNEIKSDLEKYLGLTSIEIKEKIKVTTNTKFKKELTDLYLYNYDRIKEYRNTGLFYGFEKFHHMEFDNHVSLLKKDIDEFYGLDNNSHNYREELICEGKGNHSSNSQIKRKVNDYLQYFGTGKKSKKNIPTKINRFKAAKFNWEEINSKRGNIGMSGELLVFKYETQKIINSDVSKYLDDLKHISLIEGDGAGYDIISVDEKGFPFYIEVKSTTGDLNQKLYFSKNEIDFMNEHPTKYNLYRVFNLDVEEMSGDIVIYRGRDSIFNAFELTPNSFIGEVIKK